MLCFKGIKVVCYRVLMQVFFYFEPCNYNQTQASRPKSHDPEVCASQLHATSFIDFNSVLISTQCQVNVVTCLRHVKAVDIDVRRCSGLHPLTGLLMGCQKHNDPHDGNSRRRRKPTQTHILRLSKGRSVTLIVAICPELHQVNMLSCEGKKNCRLCL